MNHELKKMKYDIYRAQAIMLLRFKLVQVQAPAVDKPPIRPIHTIPTNGTSAGWCTSWVVAGR